MDKLNDEIAAGLKQGNQKAWSKVYETYAECLWREVMRLVGGNTNDTADIVQEVFLAAATSAANFDPDKGSVWMWLVGIARNKAALRIRRQVAQIKSISRWWESLDDSARQWLDGSSDAPLEILQSRELASLIRATLLELPIDYHVVLTKKYLDDVPVKQIASEMNCSDEAVRAKLMRARKAFRDNFTRLVHSDSNT